MSDNVAIEDTKATVPFPGATGDAEPNTETTPPSAAGTSTPEAFDPVAYEQSFRLPAGSLKDAKDSESALKSIQAYVDRSLVASLNLTPEPQKVPVVPETPAAKSEAVETALEQRLVALEKQITDGQKAQQQRVEAEIDRRLSARIDDWKSNTYGVGNDRRYKQVQATATLKKLIRDHFNVLEAQLSRGEISLADIPPIEVLADRVRVWHDEDYKPEVPTKPAGTVGTPGADSPTAKGTGQPANIHEALRGNWG